MSKYCLWKQLKKHLEKEGLDISKLSNIERYCNVIEDLDTCDTQKNVDVFLDKNNRLIYISFMCGLYTTYNNSYEYHDMLCHAKTVIFESIDSHTIRAEFIFEI